MNTSEIKHITHPFAIELRQARYDHSVVTGQPLVENPWWYEHTSGLLFYDIYGCIGWPTEVTDTAEVETPGYVAIIGVVRPSDTLEHIPATDATFRVLEEYQSGDVQELLNACVRLRNQYGYGLRRELLAEFYGDPVRYLSSVCLYNERHDLELMITPPDDYDTPMIFDNYARSLRAAIQRRRIHPGTCRLFVDRLKEFRRNDPLIMAVGGLVHTLLGRCAWMDTIGENVWRMADA